MGISRDEGSKGRASAVQRPEPRVRIAARILDCAGARHARTFAEYCTFMAAFDPHDLLDWDDDVAIVSERLPSQAGFAVAALSEIKLRLHLAETQEAAALKRFAATRPRTDASRATYRAAAERYARRLTADPVEAERVLRRVETAGIATSVVTDV